MKFDPSFPAVSQALSFNSDNNNNNNKSFNVNPGEENARGLPEIPLSKFGDCSHCMGIRCSQERLNEASYGQYSVVLISSSVQFRVRRNDLRSGVGVEQQQMKRLKRMFQLFVNIHNFPITPLDLQTQQQCRDEHKSAKSKCVVNRRRLHEAGKGGVSGKNTGQAEHGMIILLYLIIWTGDDARGLSSHVA